MEKVVKNSSNRVPCLLESKGERPPEDVGGEEGYEEYLRAISDPEAPDHEFMIQWAETTRAEERTMEEINRSLRVCY